MGSVLMKQCIVDILKSIYLFGVYYASYRTRIKHEKIVFLLSFPSTSADILEALYQKYQGKLVICYTKNSSELANYYKYKNCEVYLIDRYDILIKKIVPYVTGASVVFCDNYYAFLAGIKFDNDAKVVQLWHANGAIKKFGLEAEYVKKTSKRNVMRYKKVYQTITHYVVSSSKMKKIFEENFQQSITSLNYGYPQTDNYFNSTWVRNVEKNFREKFGKNKQVLLYAPTYRDKENDQLVKTLESLQKLTKEWLVIVKLHPHDERKYKFTEGIEDIVFDLNGLSLSELLPSVDCLVTDYSSIPFEYTLANPKGKIIFYCYDYEKYQDEVGIEAGFVDWAPGFFVEDEKSFLSAIDAERRGSFQDFNQVWNEFVTGNSKEQLIEWVEKNNE